MGESGGFLAQGMSWKMEEIQENTNSGKAAELPRIAGKPKMQKKTQKSVCRKGKDGR